MRAETDQRPADFPHGLSTESGRLRDDRYRASTDSGYSGDRNRVGGSYDSHGNWIPDREGGGRRYDAQGKLIDDSDRQTQSQAQRNLMAERPGGTNAPMYTGGSGIGESRPARYYDERGNLISDRYVRYDNGGSAVEWRDGTRDPKDAGRRYADRAAGSDQGLGGGSQDRRSTDSPMYNGASRPTDDAAGVRNTFASADARVLSILHCKNQEEIELGRLAQQKGTSDEVRKYGEQLVRDHTENDAQVRNTASSAGITLVDTAGVKQILAREKGEKSEMEQSKEPKDCVAELRALNGEEFDREFAKKMQEGHREMITMLQEARTQVVDPKVRNLVDKTLPAIREHEQHAMLLDNEK
jgi:putative membrane protein